MAKGKADTWLAEVAESGGTTTTLEVAKAEVLRLNQRHKLATSGKHLSLEDLRAAVSLFVHARLAPGYLRYARKGEVHPMCTPRILFHASGA